MIQCGYKPTYNWQAPLAGRGIVRAMNVSIPGCGPSNYRRWSSGYHCTANMMRNHKIRSAVRIDGRPKAIIQNVLLMGKSSWCYPRTPRMGVSTQFAHGFQ